MGAPANALKRRARGHRVALLRTRAAGVQRARNEATASRHGRTSLTIDPIHEPAINPADEPGLENIARVRTLAASNASDSPSV
jgi:hypothetical protein